MFQLWSTTLGQRGLDFWDSTPFEFWAIFEAVVGEGEEDEYLTKEDLVEMQKKVRRMETAKKIKAGQAANVN